MWIILTIVLFSLPFHWLPKYLPYSPESLPNKNCLPKTLIDYVAQIPLLAFGSPVSSLLSLAGPGPQPSQAYREPQTKMVAAANIDTVTRGSAK